MVSAPFASFGLDALPRYSLQRIVQETNLGFVAGDAEQFTKSLEPLTPQVAELRPGALLAWARQVEPASSVPFIALIPVQGRPADHIVHRNNVRVSSARKVKAPTDNP
jgi:hypothetical protein